MAKPRGRRHSTKRDQPKVRRGRTRNVPQSQDKSFKEYARMYPAATHRRSQWRKTSEGSIEEARMLGQSSADIAQLTRPIHPHGRAYGASYSKQPSRGLTTARPRTAKKSKKKAKKR